MWPVVTRCNHIAYSLNNYQSHDFLVSWPQWWPIWPNMTCDQLRSIWPHFLKRSVIILLEQVSQWNWFKHAQTVASAAGSLEGFSSCFPSPWHWRRWPFGMKGHVALLCSVTRQAKLLLYGFILYFQAGFPVSLLNSNSWLAITKLIFMVHISLNEYRFTNNRSSYDL